MTASPSASVRASLARSGWTLTRFQEGAMIANGRDLGVTHAAAQRERLQASLCIMRGVEEGGWVDRTAWLAGARLVASATGGGYKVRAQVADGSAAESELAALVRSGTADSFEQAVAQVRSRGWTIVVEGTREVEPSSETWNESWSWHLRAQDTDRAIEVLWHARYGPRRRDLPWLEEETATASAETGSGTLSVRVLTLAEANGLVSAVIDGLLLIP